MFCSDTEGECATCFFFFFFYNLASFFHCMRTHFHKTKDGVWDKARNESIHWFFFSSFLFEVCIFLVSRSQTFRLTAEANGLANVPWAWRLRLRLVYSAWPCQCFALGYFESEIQYQAIFMLGHICSIYLLILF